MEKRPKIIIAVCLTISVIAVGYILSMREKPQTEKTNNPLPLALAKVSQETSISSPDGNWALTIREEKNKETIFYRFLISNSVDVFNKEVFAKTLPSTDTLSIPINAFSPDDKYVFLKETNSNGNTYFVLTVSGEPITKDAQILDFSSMFTAKYPDFKITDVTGWGGMNLIVINTDKIEGGIGPSFWFDVSNASFIKLSTRFN